MFDAFIAAFLPLFVAINIPGILPLYIGMAEPFSVRDRRRLLVRALAAAAVLAVLMLFAGDVIFQTLGITVNDLRVGGGLILLVIAISDLAFGKQKTRRASVDNSASTPPDTPPEAQDKAARPDLPIVPLGIPLIIGPGAITTILIAKGEFGYPPTLLAILVNLSLVFVAFTFGPRLLELLGEDTSKAVAKVASLFLAAIAVAMIRGGVTGMVGAL
ncbi:MAG: MarC family protein [Rubricoccaceae bacterium]